MLAHPSRRPDALLAAIRCELSGTEGVNEAWLMLAIRADQPGPTWMLGVGTTGPWSAVQQALGRAMRMEDLDGKPLDAVQMDGSTLSDTLRGGIPVLKKRGLLGLLGF